ncbi:Hsp70 family protein [soil metagenome]
MPGRLGIDFGTSNTVLAVWDKARNEATPLQIAEYSRTLRYRQAGKEGEEIAIIPSLIHYAADGRRWLGQQVVVQELAESERTFRWMKRYIGHRSPIQLNIDGRSISHFEAGRDFLSAVLTFAVDALDCRDEEIGLTVPVEAFEHYEHWLTSVVEATGLRRFRLIDEPSAAALGYGAFLEPQNVYLIFDFGGGTLDVSVILIEDPTRTHGQRCRVLGKAGVEIGGASIDQWLFQEALRQAGRSDSDDEVRPVSRALLAACERTKEQLTFRDQAELNVAAADGSPIRASFSRESLEALFDRHEGFRQIEKTIRRALLAAHERGYAEDQIKEVFLVGGSSLIPAVQRTVQRVFGRERVRLQRPLDAVARGAAALVAGVDFEDYVQHDYALRFVEARGSGDYAYRPLVSRGTPYPTREPIARIVVKASHDKQTQLGLAIFELAEGKSTGGEQTLELVFDPSGAARMTQVTPDEAERRHRFWINESAPTFLHADPPAKQGEPRFEVEFNIDSNKRLLVTARDLTTKQITLKDYPVVKLS